jgi:hypothetical protein
MTGDQIRQIITDAYEVCAKTADNYGSPAIAAAIRKSAGEVKVEDTKEGFGLFYMGASPAPIGNKEKL